MKKRGIRWLAVFSLVFAVIALVDVAYEMPQRAIAVGLVAVTCAILSFHEK